VNKLNLSLFSESADSDAQIRQQLGKSSRGHQKCRQKGQSPFWCLYFEEALMKTIPINRSANEIVVKEITSASRTVAAAGEAVPVEIQPTFTIAFTLGTRMKDLHDTIIRTVLQQTRGNRLRAAQLLHINPRTIRRRLGKKDTIGSVIRAA
jgi:hypothetical protein